jgi:arylsulfatase A-like enzyme
MMKRFELIWLLLIVQLLTFNFLSSCSESGREPEKLNVLFIASDDLRPMLGSYGCDHIKTPNLDRLGGKGTVFLSNYCQFPLCGPTRASLLTGLRPDEIRIWGNHTHIREIAPDVITLPQHFKQHGYHSVAYGKLFHNRALDDSLSWNEPGLPVEGHHFSDYNNPAVLEWIKDAGEGDPASSHLAPATDSANVPDNAYSDGQFTDMAIWAMKTLSEKNQPFFLAVGFVRPHLPFNCPSRYWHMYDPRQIPMAGYRELPENFPDVPVYNSWWMRHFKGMPAEGPFSDSISRHLNHAYAACVSFIDAQVGRLLFALEENGLDKNTLVVFWGDHGYQLGEHGIYGKHTNFEMAVRSPLIIYVPGMPGGQRITKLTEFVDVYPTLCELAGLPLPGHLQGISLKPLMDNPDRDWKSAAFSQYLQEQYMGHSIRTEQYRYTRWVDRRTGELKGIELYDYKSDPNEKMNLAGSGSNESVVRELEQILKDGWKGALPPQD